MNKKYLLVALASLIVFLAVAVYFVAGSKKQVLKQNQSTIQNEQTQQVNKDEQQLNLKRIFAENKDQKCIAKKAGETATFYFTTAKMFGEYTISDNNNTTKKGKLLIIDNQQYFWDSESNRGVKIAFDSNDPDLTKKSTSWFSEEVAIEFRCESWQVDTSLFALPSGVEFIDLQNLESSLPQRNE